MVGWSRLNLAKSLCMQLPFRLTPWAAHGGEAAEMGSGHPEAEQAEESPTVGSAGSTVSQKATVMSCLFPKDSAPRAVPRTGGHRALPSRVVTERGQEFVPPVSLPLSQMPPAANKSKGGGGLTGRNPKAGSASSQGHHSELPRACSALAWFPLSGKFFKKKKKRKKKSFPAPFAKAFSPRGHLQGSLPYTRHTRELSFRSPKVDSNNFSYF